MLLRRQCAAGFDAPPREIVVAGALPGRVHVSAAERPGTVISLMAVEARCDSIGLPGGDEAGEHVVTPVCRCGTAAIFSVF